MENKNKLQQDIKKFIYNYLVKLGVNTDKIDDLELVESRIISSLALIQIIAGVEEILDMQIITDNVGIEEVTTVQKIMNIVENLLEEQQ